MRIQKVRIEKLFNVFDHEIAFKLEDRVTMIYAPNGFGKTAILRMLHGLFNNRLSVFREYPFERFEVTFDDDRILSVVPKRNVDLMNPDRLQIELGLTGHGTRQLIPNIEHPGELGIAQSAVAQLVPGLTQVKHNSWSVPSGEVLEFGEILERYSENFAQYRRQGSFDIPEWFRQLRSTLTITLIGTDRLQYFSSVASHGERIIPGVTPTVASYSKELAYCIESALAKYAEVSQSLESTFPARIMTQATETAMSKEQIKEKLEAFERKRGQLAETGLLQATSMDHSPPQNPAIEDSKVLVLSVFVADTDKKLAVLEELSMKIELFRSIINSRFQHKQMKVSKESGFFFVTDSEQPLEVTKLSSGEQHEVVMLFELLFHVKRDALILMDEPEISLHVVWQQQFLKDLLKMTALSQFDVLLATHSPLIIDDRWDLTVGLGDK